METRRSLWPIILFLQFQISFLQNLSPQNEHGELVHVSALFRHGDRSPYAEYPADPYRTYPWPDGIGQLTEAGKRRMYNVGKWYRRRYADLTERIRSHTNILVRSSDRDRALMSAQCFLAGFYPPKDDRFLGDSLQWQPIPIHSVPPKYDNILLISSENPCPKKGYYEKKFFDSKSTKQLYDKNEKIFRILRNHTGYDFPKENILQAIEEVDKVYDTLLVQSENNFALPSWTGEVFPQPLSTIKDCLKFKTAEVYPNLKRLMAGPVLASVVSDMLEKHQNRSQKIFHFYSSHDNLITYVSMALGFNENVSPAYGSGLIFELWRKGNTNTVSVLFANSTVAAPYQLAIPGCGTNCTLENFTNFTRPLIPRDWHAECQVKHKRSGKRKHK